MATKEQWLAEISRLGQAGRITDLALDLDSPQFTYRNWRICAEHLKNFDSVVMGWIEDPKNPPAPKPDFKICSKSDKRKKWNYRVRLLPGDLETLLVKLDIEHRVRIINHKQIVRRANKLDDPRCVFYQEILESSSFEEYYAKVGDVSVVPPTFERRMGALVEYLYMRDHVKWIEENPDDAARGPIPDPERDARRKVWRELCARQGQAGFRQELLKMYGSRCAISGCSLEHVLEATHITPYLGPHTNELSNGLLLRADIHTLWDRGLVAVQAKTRLVWVHPEIRDVDQDYFDSINGKTLLEPQSYAARPSDAALESHWSYCQGEE